MDETDWNTGNRPPPPEEESFCRRRTFLQVCREGWWKALTAGAVGALLAVLLLPIAFGINPYDLVRGRLTLRTGQEETAPEKVTTVVSPSGGAADVAGIARKVMPQIVHIRVESPGGMAEDNREGIGSGIIYREDGYIFTNNHVTSGARSLAVTVASGQEMEARVVGSDEESDLSVIKIDRSGLPAATLGDSSTLVVGQLVVAIGSPLGFEQTVTSGIISALHRNVSAQDPQDGSQITLTDLIQTDAPTNPGSSGGALCDSNGDVIGMNTLIASQSGGSEGIGFAIPINAIKPVVEDLIAGRTVTHPYFGGTGQTVDAAVAEQFGVPSAGGAYLVSIDPDGPADRAGLKPGAVVVSANGRPVRSMDDLYWYVRRAGLGAKIELGYYEGNRRKTATITVLDRPRDAHSP